MRESFQRPCLFPAALIALFLLCCGSNSGNAAPANDGAELFRKHCSVCHPQAPAARPAAEVVAKVRTPPPGMPVFGVDKLSDQEARAIGAYIEAGAPDEPVAHKHIAPAQLAPEPETAQVQPPVAAPAPVPARIEPAPSHGSYAPDRPRKVARLSRPEKAKRPRVSSFAGNWSIKGTRNGETVTLQQVTIVEKPNNELQVVPATSLSNYTVKVTRSEIKEGTLKLQLTWSWSGSPQYWKIDTYELRLSEDGRRLSGSHTTRASGGQNETGLVWAD